MTPKSEYEQWRDELDPTRPRTLTERIKRAWGPKVAPEPEQPVERDHFVWVDPWEGRS